MTFNVPRVRALIQIIESNLARLEQLRPLTFEEFCADFRTVEASKHLLQVSIEAMIDICAHFVSRLRLATPEDGAELFRRLGRAGLLPEDHVSTYVQMVKFRNLLVHLYGEVDEARVYSFVQGELDDFRMFIRDAWQIVQRYAPDADG